MAASISTAELTRQLASAQRVLVLGGLAVVAHGHSRPTYDADVWLDPTLSVEKWSDVLLKLIDQPFLSIISIGNWHPISAKDLPRLAEEDGVVRIMGANQPLDVFRKPNELPMEEFDRVWDFGIPLDDGTRIPDVIDLLVTKQDTGRTKDTQDIAYLEAKAEEQYLAELPYASAEKAALMLERFLTPKIAEAALIHLEKPIQELDRRFLLELAADGDPFAAEIVRTHRLAES